MLGTSPIFCYETTEVGRKVPIGEWERGCELEVRDLNEGIHRRVSVKLRAP